MMGLRVRLPLAAQVAAMVRPKSEGSNKIGHQDQT